MGKSDTNSNTYDRHLASVLERIGEVSRAQRMRQSANGGLSPLQLRILAFVAEHPDSPIGVARLADELQIGRPTISESVRLLVEKGLLLRRADPADKRGHILRLSSKAARRMDDGSPLDDALAELPTSSKDALLLGLMQVLHQLAGSGKVQVQRMCFTCAHYAGDCNGQHRCLLLKKTLRVRELRSDCAEHEAA